MIHIKPIKGTGEYVFLACAELENVPAKRKENSVAQPRLVHKIAASAPLRVSIGSAGSRHPFTPSTDTRLKANGLSGTGSRLVEYGLKSLKRLYEV